MALNDPKGTVRTYVIASGSKANCVAIWSKDGGILVDCGLSPMTAINHLHVLGLNPIDLRGILVTHEHCDHTKGVNGVSHITNTPIVTEPATAQKMEFENVLTPPCDVGPFHVESFPVPHDALDPVGFLIGCGEARVGYLTDTGYITKHIFERLKGIKLLFIEANHDVRMLEASNRHPNLKARINGGHGHLSNVAAASLIKSLANHGLEKAVLLHISEVANTHELALQSCQCDGVKISVEKFGLLEYI